MGKKTEKNIDNPFAALNAAQFPSQEQNAKKEQKKEKIKIKDAKKSAMLESGLNEDSALFLGSLGNVQILSSEKGKKQPAPKKEDTSFADILFSQPDVASTDPIKKARIPSPPLRMDLPHRTLHDQPEKKDFSVPEAFLTAQNAIKENLRNEEPEEKEKQKAETKSRFLDIPGTEDELAAFYRATADVKTLNGKGREIIPELQTPPLVQPVSNPMQDFMDGKLEFSLSATDEYVEGHVVGLDLLTLGSLQERRFSPEAHIDLHGLNSEQAYQNLVAFFRSAYHRGYRTVLVVTGRGKNSLNGMPVLRSKIQEWFIKDPFRRVILAFCTAKQEDGGAGALYVLIRKQKKSYGKIHWDMVPTDPDFFL